MADKKARYENHRNIRYMWYMLFIRKGNETTIVVTEKRKRK